MLFGQVPFRFCITFGLADEVSRRSGPGQHGDENGAFCKNARMTTVRIASSTWPTLQVRKLARTA